MRSSAPRIPTACPASVAEIPLDPTYGCIAAAAPQALAEALRVAVAMRPDLSAMKVLRQRHQADNCVDAYLALLDAVVAAKHHAEPCSTCHS